MVPLAANATPTSHTTVIPATARMSRLDPSFVLCPFHGLMSCSFLKFLDSNMIFELGKKDGARQSYSRARSIHDGLKQGQHRQARSLARSRSCYLACLARSRRKL